MEEGPNKDAEKQREKMRERTRQVYYDYLDENIDHIIDSSVSSVESQMKMAFDHAMEELNRKVGSIAATEKQKINSALNELKKRAREAAEGQGKVQISQLHRGFMATQGAEGSERQFLKARRSLPAGPPPEKVVKLMKRAFEVHEADAKHKMGIMEEMAKGLLKMRLMDTLKVLILAKKQLDLSQKLQAAEKADPAQPLLLVVEEVTPGGTPISAPSPSKRLQSNPFRISRERTGYRGEWDLTDSEEEEEEEERSLPLDDLDQEPRGDRREEESTRIARLREELAKVTVHLGEASEHLDATKFREMVLYEEQAAVVRELTAEEEGLQETANLLLGSSAASLSPKNPRLSTLPPAHTLAEAEAESSPHGSQSGKYEKLELAAKAVERRELTGAPGRISSREQRALLEDAERELEKQAKGAGLVPANTPAFDVLKQISPEQQHVLAAKIEIEAEQVQQETKELLVQLESVPADRELTPTDLPDAAGSPFPEYPPSSPEHSRDSSPIVTAHRATRTRRLPVENPLLDEINRASTPPTVPPEAVDLIDPKTPPRGTQFARQASSSPPWEEEVLQSGYINKKPAPTEPKSKKSARTRILMPSPSPEREISEPPPVRRSFHEEASTSRNPVPSSPSKDERRRGAGDRDTGIRDPTPDERDQQTTLGFSVVISSKRKDGFHDMIFDESTRKRAEQVGPNYTPIRYEPPKPTPPAPEHPEEAAWRERFQRNFKLPKEVAQFIANKYNKQLERAKKEGAEPFFEKKIRDAYWEEYKEVYHEELKKALKEEKRRLTKLRKQGALASSSSSNPTTSTITQPGLPPPSSPVPPTTSSSSGPPTISRPSLVKWNAMPEDLLGASLLIGAGTDPTALGALSFFAVRDYALTERGGASLVSKSRVILNGTAKGRTMFTVDYSLREASGSPGDMKKELMAKPHGYEGYEHVLMFDLEGIPISLYRSIKEGGQKLIIYQGFLPYGVSNDLSDIKQDLTRPLGWLRHEMFCILVYQTLYFEINLYDLVLRTVAIPPLPGKVTDYTYVNLGNEVRAISNTKGGKGYRYQHAQGMGGGWIEDKQLKFYPFYNAPFFLATNSLPAGEELRVFFENPPRVAHLRLTKEGKLESRTVKHGSEGQPPMEISLPAGTCIEVANGFVYMPCRAEKIAVQTATYSIHPSLSDSPIPKPIPFEELGFQHRTLVDELRKEPDLVSTCEMLDTLKLVWNEMTPYRWYCTYLSARHLPPLTMLLSVFHILVLHQLKYKEARDASVFLEALTARHRKIPFEQAMALKIIVEAFGVGRNELRRLMDSGVAARPKKEAMKINLVMIEGRQNGPFLWDMVLKASGEK